MTMAGKAKFQIARQLDERIKKLVEDADSYEPELAKITQASILGFHTGNVTNYVGLTTNYRGFNSALSVVGIVFFKSTPNDEEIQKNLSDIKKYIASSEGMGNFAQDTNKDLFLIYSTDKNEPKQAVKRMFDSSTGQYLQEQPKLSVLDENKIYNHSFMVKLSLSLNLDIYNNDYKLDKEEMERSLLLIDKDLRGKAGEIDFHLLNSNSTCDLSDGIEKATETLYDKLDPPSDLDQMGDYLPQMTKADKQKLVDKWRNKKKSQRDPLEFKLEHQHLSFRDVDQIFDQHYGLKIELFHRLHANDTITKSRRSILYLLRQVVRSLLKHLICQSTRQLENDELKVCTFQPRSSNHLVTALYAIPKVGKPDYQLLHDKRRELHMSYMLPLKQPLFRYSQRIQHLSLKNKDEDAGYLCNVHTGLLEYSGLKNGLKNVIDGTYTYHHYMQDRVSDNGWGCAYRSLQTIISWFKHQGYIYSPDVEVRAMSKKGNSNVESKTSSIKLREILHLESRVPTHEEIQSVLVDVGDKQPSFIGSQKWIGSQEVCYVLNHLYDIDCKFISVSSGSELVYKARDLGQHFVEQSTPIMIGGGVLAHTIIGIDFNEKNGDVSYLILDPHYTGSEDLAIITKKGWCGWKKNNFWDKGAFYNLCLPQRPQEI